MLIRNALFHRVQLVDLDKPEALGALDKEWGYGVHEWRTRSTTSTTNTST